MRILLSLLLISIAAFSEDNVSSDLSLDYISSDLSLSSDSEGFTSHVYSIGTGKILGNNRIGVKFSKSDYSNRSGNGYYITGTGVYNNLTISGELGKNLNKTAGKVIATATINNIHYEAGIERNIVESEVSLDNNVMNTSYYIAVDKDFSTRWNLAGVVHYTDFSNDNHRFMYRTKLNYLISEEYGISTYIKSKSYTNSNPYNGAYFSPESYDEILGGLSVRRRLPHKIMFSGYIEKGRQKVDDIYSDTYGYAVKFSTIPKSNITWSLNIGSFVSAGGLLGAPDYRYNYLIGSILIQF